MGRSRHCQCIHPCVQARTRRDGSGDREAAAPDHVGCLFGDHDDVGGRPRSANCDFASSGSDRHARSPTCPIRANLLSLRIGASLSLFRPGAAGLAGCRGVSGCWLISAAASLLGEGVLIFFFVGWLWYLITLLPVIGLVPGGIQFMADRYTYVTQIWPLHGGGLGGRRSDPVVAAPARGRWSRIGHGAAGPVMLCAWFQTGPLAQQRNACRRHTLDMHRSDNAFAHQSLGGFLQNTGRKARPPSSTRKPCGSPQTH